MKKTIITLAAIAAMTFTANAQIFVGGSAGLNFNGGNTTTNGTKTDKESKVGFTVAPNVGWYFADNFLAGARLGLGYDKDTTPGALADTKKSSFTWALQPYARYRFAEWNSFGLWSEVNLGLGRTTGKTEVGNISTDNNPVLAWGLHVLPVLTYSVNEHLCLETSLNFLTLGYEGSYTKNDDKTYEENASSFTFGASANDVIGAIGQVKVGFTYRF